ncbi:MAG: leucyl aminopeptidase [Gammaproteobacteria bacterium]|nr:leucyl aminopeptidase [Gammaproteobacteria bacterium]
MQYTLQSSSLPEVAQESVDILLILLSSKFLPESSTPGVVSQIEQSILDTVIAQDFNPQKTGQFYSTWYLPSTKAKRTVLLACETLSNQHIANALKELSGKFSFHEAKTVCIYLPESGAGNVESALTTFAQLNYVYRATKPSAIKSQLSKVILATPQADSLQTEFSYALARIKGEQLAKDLANQPANLMTPSNLAQTALSLTEYANLSCTIRSQEEIEKLQMGAFLAVAKGSREPTKFIELQYKAPESSSPPIILVGKGITFDSGGLSLKPAQGMEEMKSDMSGAACVLGVFRALGLLQPRVHVIGLIPACENMPDGNAVKPGDVVTSMSGKTIEILNTDAEGRLILCDALTYAKKFSPKLVIDIATLTGACVVALGYLHTGMYANDDDLSQKMQAAGKAAQDTCWPLPLDDEYAQGLKSDFADLSNIATGRYRGAAGSITAAKFLHEFVDYPWIHLDIAGSARTAKGSSGRPVGMLLHFILAQTLDN